MYCRRTATRDAGRHLKTPDDEAALTADIVRLATQYGRYGYRRIREMLVAEGWRVNVSASIGSGVGKG
jgi:putative transposase